MPIDATAVRILGPLCVRSETAAHAVSDILAALPSRASLRVAFANTHLLYHALKDADFAARLSQFQLLNDGIGVELLARLYCGRGFDDNLNGTDLVPRVLSGAPPGTRVYLYGAKSTVLKAVADRLTGLYPQLTLCGLRDGYDSRDGLIEDVRRAAPDIVLVALGNPRQERWICECAQAAPAGAYLAVGALFDFLAGSKPRAPLFLRWVRLEWLFRLALEPARLWRRYTLEIGYVTWALSRGHWRSATSA